MKPLGYAPEAVADLRQIAAYIAEDDPLRALTFVAELERAAAEAALRPRSFRERPELSAGIRAVEYRRYLIFFRELPDEVRVVRVVHGARELSRLF